MRKLFLLLTLALVSTFAAASTTQGAPTTRYAFNALHQLVKVTLPDGTTIDYGYGPDGNLASRSKTPSNGKKTTTHYLVDPTPPFPQIVAEYDDAGHPTATFVYGDELLGRTQAGKDSYYEHDGHGSVAVVTDASGAVVRSATYDAWGNPVETSGADDDPYGYVGERRDVDTGLIYLRARWYDPSVGRFLSPDPAPAPQDRPASLNAYLYADGEPVGGVDPAGRQTTADLVAAESDAQIQASTALPNMARPIFKKFACRMGEVVALEAITYGIYVLSDGTSFYVGRSVDIERRFAQHLRGILASLEGNWQVVDRFAVSALGAKGKQASRDLLRIAEQTVMDLYKESGKPLLNRVNSIDKVNGRLRDAFEKYGKALCK